MIYEFYSCKCMWMCISSMVWIQGRSAGFGYLDAQGSQLWPGREFRGKLPDKFVVIMFVQRVFPLKSQIIASFQKWTPTKNPEAFTPEIHISGPILRIRQQLGVLRTNCFDSLDRTNLLQYQVPRFRFCGQQGQITEFLSTRASFLSFHAFKGSSALAATCKILELEKSETARGRANADNPEETVHLHGFEKLAHAELKTMTIPHGWWAQCATYCCADPHLIDGTSQKPGLMKSLPGILSVQRSWSYRLLPVQ